MSGIFITIDGIDGAGKTTQVALLAGAFRAAGEEVVTSKEPTEGPWGRKIRDSAAGTRLPIEAELEAFIEDRKAHVAEIVQPALDAGNVVILDRYFYSTIAYQGVRTGDVTALDRRMRALAPVPDVAVILDVDPTLSLCRITQRDGQPNAFERMDNLRDVRRVFLSLCETDPVLECVDGSGSIRLVHNELIELLVDGVFKRKRCAKHYGCDDAYWCGFRMQNLCPWWRLRCRLLDRNTASDSRSPEARAI